MKHFFKALVSISGVPARRSAKVGSEYTRGNPYGGLRATGEPSRGRGGALGLRGDGPSLQQRGDGPSLQQRGDGPSLQQSAVRVLAEAVGCEVGDGGRQALLAAGSTTSPSFGREQEPHNGMSPRQFTELNITGGRCR